MANSRDTIPIRPATNQVLFPRITMVRSDESKRCIMGISKSNARI